MLVSRDDLTQSNMRDARENAAYVNLGGMGDYAGMVNRNMVVVHL